MFFVVVLCAKRRSKIHAEVLEAKAATSSATLFLNTSSALLP
jgi:hypothetical protein